MTQNIMLVLVSIALFCGCAKQDQEQDSDQAVAIPGNLHKEYFHKNVDQLNVYSFNKAGKLLFYDYYFDGYVPYRTEHTYLDDKLKAVTYLEKRSGRFALDRQFAFSYDATGRIAEITLNRASEPFYWSIDPPQPVYPKKYVFTYPDATSDLFDVCVIYYQYTNREMGPAYEDHFEYDTRGNIILSTRYRFADGSKTLHTTSDYEYIAAANPNYQLTLTSLDDLPEYFSPNMRSKSRTTNESGTPTMTAERQFKFDGQGRVIEFDEAIEIYGPSYANKKRYFEYVPF